MVIDMKNVIVIGGGAGGILLSIALKQKTKDINVTILEKDDRIGKKILKTGNGKCNITNSNLNPSYYNDSEFVTPVLSKYNYEVISEYLSSLGLMMKSDDEGRVYPLSESAASVLDVLMEKLKELKINVVTGSEVVDVKSKTAGYMVKTVDAEYEADYVVISSGSRAQMKNYNNSYIKKLGLKLTDERPGLVSVLVKDKIISLSGVRTKCGVELYDNEEVVYSGNGEVLFKDDYLSGIVIMSASRFIGSGNYRFSIDLVKDKSEDQLYEYLCSLNKDLKGEHILMGVLPKMLSIYVLKYASISLEKCLGDLSVSDKRKIAKSLKNLVFNVIGVNGFDKAQITLGGISLDEIEKTNLSLKRYDNVYVIGEVMDVDGECGGFNLSWAWAGALSVADDINKKGSR